MALAPDAAVPLSDLWRVVGGGMAEMLRDGPDFEATSTPGDWSAISGEPRALFNWLAIHTAHADNEARLRAGVAALRARRLPALVAIAEALAAGLAPVARELELDDPHPGRLMLLHPNRPATRPAPPELAVERVRDASGWREAIHLLAVAFAEPHDAVARSIGPGRLTAPALSVYVVRAGSDPLSTCWIYRDGPLVCVTAMATSPAHQRRGAGRAVLTHALTEHAASGATVAVLIASAEGRPLYEQLGFRVVDAGTQWVLR